jgi:hypothetical protein
MKGAARSSGRQPPAKELRFGNTTVRQVEKWIVPREHIYKSHNEIMNDPPRGWKVTPLEEPDSEGEDCKYVTVHGGDSLIWGHSVGGCDTPCAWNQLAALETRMRAQAGMDPESLQGVPVSLVLSTWNFEREMMRLDGTWVP